MAWTCKLYQSWEDVEAEYGRGPIPVGTMWYSPWYLEHPNYLSRPYMERWAGKRPPLFVHLPGGVDFCVDSRPTRGGRLDDGGWEVTGEAPHITVSPSISILGVYHGFIREGVVTDDVDGRVF